MTKGEAIKLIKTNWWAGKTANEIVQFQLYEPRLCIPFTEFHKAIEEALGRPVWTHEFADQKGLQAEFEGRQDAPQSPLESLQRVAPHLAGKVILINH